MILLYIFVIIIGIYMIIKLSKNNERFETSSSLLQTDIDNLNNKINKSIPIPKFTICSFNTQNMRSIPKGWALCDGYKYSLDNNMIAIINENGTNTPDLRDKFILGAGEITINNNNISIFNLIEKNRFINKPTASTTTSEYSICRTFDNKYPPYTQLKDEGYNCSYKCDIDSRCSGYQFFARDKKCQLFDMTDSNLKGTAPSGSRLLKKSSTEEWKCNLKETNIEYYQTKIDDVINFSIGDTGGEKEHKLLLVELATHTHDYVNGTIGAKFSPNQGDDDKDLVRGDFIYSGGGYDIIGDKEMIQATGNDKPHNNMPPYYVLVYIMKL